MKKLITVFSWLWLRPNWEKSFPQLSSRILLDAHKSAVCISDVEEGTELA